MLQASERHPRRIRATSITRRPRRRSSLTTRASLGFVTGSYGKLLLTRPGGPVQQHAVAAHPSRSFWLGTPAFALDSGEGCPAEALRAKAGCPLSTAELRLGKPANSPSPAKAACAWLILPVRCAPLEQNQQPLGNTIGGRPRILHRNATSAAWPRCCPSINCRDSERFVYVLEKLAPSRLATTSASRPTCDAGWLRITLVAPHTRLPTGLWRLLAAVEFAEESSAVRFEAYLKTGSGRRVREATLRPNPQRLLYPWRRSDSNEANTNYG